MDAQRDPVVYYDALRPWADQQIEDRREKRDRNVVGSGLFDSEKKRALDTLLSPIPDRSRAGQIDTAIVPLVEVINSRRDYYTTSSCAGRLIATQHVPGRPKYNQVDWLFVTHDIIDQKETHPMLEKLVSKNFEVKR